MINAVIEQKKNVGLRLFRTRKYLSLSFLYLAAIMLQSKLVEVL